AVGYRADALGAEIGVEPLRIAFRDDRDHLAALHPQRGEAEAGMLGVLAVLGPGDRLPDAEILLAHRHLGAALLHLAPEIARQGVALYHLEDIGIDFHARLGVALLRCIRHGRPPVTTGAASLLAPGLAFLPAALAAYALFLHAEVEFLDVFLLEQPGAGIGHHDAADLQHIAVMGGVQRHVGVLLDQQDGGLLLGVDADRSEERRVGSEGRSRGWAYESNRI